MTKPATHKGMREDSNLTSNSWRTMAARGNIIRRLIKAFLGPTEAVEDLPYLPELKGNITEVISGITKEITANSQEPDQTSNTSRTTFRRPFRTCQGVTKKLPWEITIYHHLPYLAVTTFSPHLLPPQHVFTTLFSPSAQRLTPYHIHHQTPSFITTYLIHSTTFISQTHLFSPTATISRQYLTFHILGSSSLNHDFPPHQINFPTAIIILKSPSSRLNQITIKAPHLNSNGSFLVSFSM